VVYRWIEAKFISSLRSDEMTRFLPECEGIGRFRDRRQHTQVH
jgi:hypothetical protein